MKLNIKSRFNSLLSFFGYQVLRIENSLGFKEFVAIRNLEMASGVLHIGAHFGEERFLYSELNKPVLWIEAVPDYFQLLAANISGFANQEARLLLLSDSEKQADFFIANNEGASSSLFRFAENNGFENSGLRMERQIRLTTVRLDRAFQHDEILLFDHWVIDVQGAEMEVLRGAGLLLKSCNSMMIEVSRREIYVGGSSYFDLTEFLEKEGFVQIWEAHRGEHMDILFIRRR
jgi:FkbM family methyltransferase